MKANEVIKKAKELLSIDIEVEEVKLAQASLENGTVIEFESLAAGQEIFIVTDDEKVALPVGEYTLEDGQMLKVEEEGIIASVGAAEEEEEVEANEQELEGDHKEEMEYATKQELSEIREMVEEIKAMISDKEEMSAEEAPVEAEEVKEELSAAEPVEKVKHNPEGEAENSLHLYAQKSPQTTMDRVLAQMSKFKNK